MDREELGKRAIAAAYTVGGYAACIVESTREFRLEHATDPADITGDYVSDVVAELRDTVRKLSAVVRELDKVRAELDAASMAGVAAYLADKAGN